MFNILKKLTKVSCYIPLDVQFMDAGLSERLEHYRSVDMYSVFKCF